MYSVKKYEKEIKSHEIQIPISEFLASFNKNMPAGFPKVSEAQLKKFKEQHLAFFKNGDFWSLDKHRKKIIDWLPRNGNMN